jgi:hypothetical protein
MYLRGNSIGTDQTDRQTDRRTDRRTDRQTDRRTHFKSFHSIEDSVRDPDPGTIGKLVVAIAARTTLQRVDRANGDKAT